MKKKVLVFPCGSEIGLEVCRSLACSKDFELFGGNSTPDHGEYVFKNYIDNIPFVDDDEFIDKINKIIDEYKIDLVIPAHDSVVLKLAQHRDEVHAIVVTSSAYACEICRSKKKTYELFNGILNVPKMYAKEEVVESDFPLFLKPDVGQGSKGAQKIHNFAELNLLKTSDNLLLEYLPGDEFTIDCFTNFKGELLYCAGRKRNRILNGISVSTFLVEDDEFNILAQKINDKLKMNGAWFFQVKLNKDGKYSLLEIAPRIAGTMEYQRSYGVNLPMLSLYNALEIPVSIVKNNYFVYMDRALQSSFRFSYDYNKVYVDLDDTLILDGNVHYELLGYLYRCLNEKKKIILLTRHAIDPKKTLEKYHIDISIFDEIIHIDKEKNKSDFVTDKNSIFIDDSHRERKDVSEKIGIPVFDINMIDILLN